MTPTETIAKISALREQADYLLSPFRKTGPSVHEARETAASLTIEADTLTESFFWESARKTQETYLKPV